MSSGFNFWYELLGLPSSKFAAYYSFDTFSGTNVIPSVSGANGLYSGTVQGATGAFGLQNSSGLFNGFDYLKVNSVAGLTGNNWSQIFVFERTGAGTGTLFSSLTSPTANSGYAIGINNANKLYFQYNTGAPAYYVFDQILAKKNAINVTLSNTLLEFDYYNFNLRKFESQSFTTRGLLFNSDQWTIGRGFSGAIDDWIYLDGNVSKSNRERLFSGFYSLLDLSSGSQLYVTGYNSFQVGEISGDFKVYTTGYIEYSGNVNYSSDFVSVTDPSSLSLFGDFIDQCSISTPIYTYQGVTGKLASNKIVPITGDLQTVVAISGVSSIEPTLSSTLQITGYLESGYVLGTGITGLEVIENVTLLDNCGNVSVAYTYNNLTGTISGTTFIEQTGLVYSWDTSLTQYSVGQLVITQAILNTPRSIDASRITPFGYDALTYLGNYENGEQIEFVAFPNETQILNIDKMAGFDTVRSAEVLDAKYSSGKLNFYLNGLLQQESGIVLIGDVYSNRLEWQGDYYLDSNLIYGSGYEISDLGFYDYLVANIRGFKQVSGIGTYPLTIGAAANKDFYLNGQKIYTGDYVLAGQTVTLTGGYEVVTGVLTYIERYPSQGSVLGVKTTVTGRFLKDTSFMVQNGVRYSTEGFVEHSSLDKIAGSNTFPAGADELYGDEGTFWE